MIDLKKVIIKEKKVDTVLTKSNLPIAGYSINTADKNKFMYVIDEEPFLKNPTGKPIIINYFYHEKIRQSSKNKK